MRGELLASVAISVSDIRREIYRASEFTSGTGQPSTELLGSLFHRAFRLLMDPVSDCCWTSVLDRESLNDSDRLRDHAYTAILGPHLSRQAGQLQNSAREVLDLWEATGHLCKHVCQLLTNSYQQRLLRYEPHANRWHGAEQFVTETKLTWLVEDSSWTAPVLVSGVADAVWRNPASRQWCVLELKLGAGSEEADMAQICLYHDMLQASDGAGMGRLSLWHFQPELKRTHLSGEQIEPVRAKLRALIGRMAGVIPPQMRASVKIAEYEELGNQLVRVLEEFGPMVTLDSDPVIGPTFLRFHIRPGPGVQLRKILPLGGDLAVQLRLSSPALISLENGTLVIDVQRPDRETLFFSEFRPQLPRPEKGSSKLLVGVDLQRRARDLDLSSECPHVLVAGTAGSGKSEWLRMTIAGLIATNTPASLRLMLIDPKRVTFGELYGSPYLLDAGAGSRGALLFTPDEAMGGLHHLIELMEERYSLFAQHGVADVQALNQQIKQPLPRIVCFCDEYGNLVAQKKARDIIELAITQLGAKARAAGIHLIIATQDPRAQILSPVLKSNLGGRVCLRTTTSMQSRMMLEQNGAESLLGHGDLFFKTIGEPIRLQAPLLDEGSRRELFGV